MTPDQEQRRDALLWAAEALPIVHRTHWIKTSSVIYWLTSWANATPSRRTTRDLTDAEFTALLREQQPLIDAMRDDPEWTDEAFARRAAEAMEPVESVLAEHQPSETPGRCSCGFWEVTRHADHQAAMLRGEGLLARPVDR